MNILLSRILTYLNGTLFHDYNYKICTFIIFHYLIYIIVCKLFLKYFRLFLTF